MCLHKKGIEMLFGDIMEPTKLMYTHFFNCDSESALSFIARCISICIGYHSASNRKEIARLSRLAHKVCGAGVINSNWFGEGDVYTGGPERCCANNFAGGHKDLRWCSVHWGDSDRGRWEGNKHTEGDCTQTGSNREQNRLWWIYTCRP